MDSFDIRISAATRDILRAALARLLAANPLPFSDAAQEIIVLDDMLGDLKKDVVNDFTL